MNAADEALGLRPNTSATGGVGGDLLQEARETVAEIMRGDGGRNAKARLEAALAILDKGYLGNLSDESLLAEVKRRAAEK